MTVKGRSNQGRSRFAQPSLAPVLIRIAGAVAAGGLSIAAARLLDVADFAELVGLMALVSVASVLGAGGVGRSSLRMLAVMPTRSDETSRIAGSALAALVPSILAAMVVTIGGCMALGVSWPTAAVAMIATAGGSASLVMSDLLRGVDDPIGADASFGRLGGLAATGIAVALVLVWRPTNSRDLMVALLIGIAVSLCWQLFRLTNTTSLSHARSTRTELGASGRPFLVNQVALSLNGLADVWLGSVLLSSRAGADYGAAARLVVFVGMPALALHQTIARPLARSWASEDVAEVQRRTQQVARGTAWLTAPLIVGLACVSPWLITTVFGDGFGGAAWILLILLVGQIAAMLAGPAGILLAMTGHERELATASVLAGVATVVGGAIGASLGGAVGLAVASTLATTAMYAYMWFVARRDATVRTDPLASSPPSVRPGVERRGDRGVRVESRR